MKKTITLIIEILLISMSLVSAYSWGYGYSSTPADYLENPWVMFGVIFIVFFGIIYFSISKAFKESKGPALVISLALSFAIAAIFSQRVTLYGYLGDSFGDTVMLIAGIVALAFILKIIYTWFKTTGVIILSWLGFILLASTDLYDKVPWSWQESSLFTTINYLAGGENGDGLFLGIILMIVLTIIIIALTKSIKKKKTDETFNKVKKGLSNLISSN